jgi:threonine synthase
MTTTINNAVAREAQRESPRALQLRCRDCGRVTEPAASAICVECHGAFEPFYDDARSLPDRATIASRPASIWRYREWLPFEGEAVYAREVGWTPLIEAPRIARRLGVRRAWVKNDSVSHPSLSFKDRVVAAAINAAASFGIRTIGCASTGNLANAVAAQAAREGLDAWVFIPHDLEAGKVLNTSIFGPKLVRVRGTYDDVNRLCAQVANRFGWGIVNVNLRAYYGEGSKTMAFEIAEQLGWRLPTAVVAPMAGGSLVTKLRKGFAEFTKAGLVTGSAPRVFGAQASGCAPIARLVQNGGELVPETPHTIARSIAIGSPADGRYAARAIIESGGWAAHVSDAELVEGIRILAQDVGVFTETAGGVTVAAALVLAADGRFSTDDEVVLCITGNGLKTVEVLRGELPESPVIDAQLSEVAALVASAATV